MGYMKMVVVIAVLSSLPPPLHENYNYKLSLDNCAAMVKNPNLDAAVRDTQASLAKSMSNFDANAILRGAQLTIVGGLLLVNCL